MRTIARENVNAIYNALAQRTARICAALVELLERTKTLGLDELALVQAQADWTAALDQAAQASGTITRVTKA